LQRLAKPCRNGIKPLVYRLTQFALCPLKPATHVIDAGINVSQALLGSGCARPYQENDECPGGEARQQANYDEDCFGHQPVLQ
jgi:hypothetical protein